MQNKILIYASKKPDGSMKLVDDMYTNGERRGVKALLYEHTPAQYDLVSARMRGKLKYRKLSMHLADTASDISHKYLLGLGAGERGLDSAQLSRLLAMCGAQGREVYADFSFAPYACLGPAFSLLTQFTEKTGIFVEAIVFADDSMPMVDMQKQLARLAPGWNFLMG